MDFEELLETPDAEEETPQDNSAKRLNLEEALQGQEARIDALLKDANKYVGALKAWKKACAEGHLVNRQKQATLATELAPALAAPAQETAGAWDFDVRAYLESDDWRKELEAAAQAIGLRVINDENTLVSSPVVIRSQPGSSRILLGKEAWATLRPKLTAEKLRKLRDRAAASNSQEFLEALYAACNRQSEDTYRFTTFRNIYAQFAETPGWKKENPPAVFGQAIYALHRSDIRATRSGRTFEIQSGSGNAKDKDLFIVISEDGRPVKYYGILFR